MLDTNSCVYLFAGHPALTRRVAACPRDGISISSVVLAELLIGTARGYGPDQVVLEAFLDEVRVLPFDAQAARAYARLPFKRGRVDHLIAAHALSLDAVLITANLRDFSIIPGLSFEDWTGQRRD
jgi:tRNA(fMet)-specific endonuclease VapC